MYKQITIQTLNKQGVKHSEIAKLLGCHRNTIRNALQREHPIENQTRQKPSTLETYKEHIKAWIEKKQRTSVSTNYLEKTTQ